ncbi:MAG: glutamate-1-semialdehyde 2,1-aminomutase [Desulfatiglans sp.]|jgi:glutamate-1-semialdehyde 2,1-aminomutase|nr:glutamate-1-semialdehyde 2,1-aminomutase [Desulfatiglans sp.]
MGEKSKELFKRARLTIPGGVNSPVRACKTVGMDPPFIMRGEGCFLFDVEGNKYIDYVGSWGPLILGHAHPTVVESLAKAIEQGTSYGAPTELEVELAELVVEMVPSVEMVRMVNSGTEATMSTIRLARGYTNREKIIKFDGCYHGHADSLLVSAGSGVATLGIPDSPGVPKDLARHTISLPYNDIQALEQAFQSFGPDIAAVIVEPIPGNMGVVMPNPDFLKGMRQLTHHHNSLLIFDEVMSGFRVSPGGAQKLYGIMPDLTCLGKIIGGGLPVGAYGGKREIMEHMAPEGNIYQAGTLSGNPLAMTAGISTLKILKQEGPYEQLEKKGDRLFSGLKREAEAAGIDIVINRIGSMGCLFFTPNPVTDFNSAKACDTELYKKYYISMIEQGIYLAPSPYEALFLSTAHGDKEISRTIDCAAVAFRNLSA